MKGDSMLTDPKKSQPFHGATRGRYSSPVVLQNIYAALLEYVKSLSHTFNVQNVELLADTNLFLKELIASGFIHAGNKQKIRELRERVWARQDRLKAGVRVENGQVRPAIDFVDMEQLISDLKSDIKAAKKLAQFIDLDLAHFSNNMIQWLELARYFYEATKDPQAPVFPEIALGKIRLVTAAITSSKSFHKTVTGAARNLHAQADERNVPEKIGAAIDQLLADLRPYMQAA
jgi:hypothetical protein